VWKRPWDPPLRGSRFGRATRRPPRCGRADGGRIECGMRVVDRAQRAGRDRCGGVALWTHGRKGLGERDVTTSCRLRDLSTTPGMRGVETLTRGNAFCAHRRCKAWRQSASQPACREAAAIVLPRRTASRNAADPEAAQGKGRRSAPLGGEVQVRTPGCRAANSRTPGNKPRCHTIGRRVQYAPVRRGNTKVERLNGTGVGTLRRSPQCANTGFINPSNRVRRMHHAKMSKMLNTTGVGLRPTPVVTRSLSITH